MTPTAGTTDPNLPHKPSLSPRGNELVGEDKPSCCALRLEKLRRVTANIWCVLKENMRKVRVLLGVLAVLVLVGTTTGCGLVSDQTKQDAKKKLGAKGQEVKKEVDAQGQ